MPVDSPIDVSNRVQVTWLRSNFAKSMTQQTSYVGSMIGAAWSTQADMVHFARCQLQSAHEFGFAGRSVVQLLDVMLVHVQLAL